MKLDPNLKAPHEIQYKFEFYLLVLTFTLLGFAIQTSNFIQSAPADLSEIVGWLLLLVSGVIGLWRLEWIPVAYNTYTEIKRIAAEIDYCKNLLKTGIEEMPVGDVEKPQSVSKVVDLKNSQLKTLFEKFERVECRTLLKYKCQKALFVLSLR